MTVHPHKGASVLRAVTVRLMDGLGVTLAYFRTSRMSIPSPSLPCKVFVSTLVNLSVQSLHSGWSFDLLMSNSISVALKRLIVNAVSLPTHRLVADSNDICHVPI